MSLTAASGCLPAADGAAAGERHEATGSREGEETDAEEGNRAAVRRARLAQRVLKTDQRTVRRERVVRTPSEASTSTTEALV